MRARWTQVALTALAAGVTVVVVDPVVARISPPRYVREVVDALNEYQHEDPTVLVLGSSHARTFSTMDGIIRERTGGKARIMSVPLEFGRFRSYEWVLQHRLRPLMDATNAQGRQRPSLRHVILLTAWWDATGSPPTDNLPSRAWTLRHFVDDVADVGLQPTSRNYLRSRWLELWHGSILVSDRGHGRVLAAFGDVMMRRSPAAIEARDQRKLTAWQEMMKKGAASINEPEELKAAERILVALQADGYDVTLMLYPMMPVTMTQAWRDTVQAPFAARMKALALQHGIRFVDTTYDNNVNHDSDFQPDFDHLTPAGHVKFCEWLLDGPLAFLLETGPAQL